MEALIWVNSPTIITSKLPELLREHHMFPSYEVT
jgi:hypothetical protein